MGDIPIPSLSQILASIAAIVGFSVIIGWAIADSTAPDETLENVIESTTVIVPEIKLVVTDNVVDTIYVYRQPVQK